MIPTIDSTPPRQLSLKKKALFASLVFIFCALVAEAGLRVAGLRPWTVERNDIRVEPGGRLYQPDATRGYKYLPGRYTVTLPTGWTFRVTHKQDTLRVTCPEDCGQGGPDAGNAGRRDRETWIFGCSYTYGWTVNDEETYVWLLGQQFPEERFVNFAVDGYGTIHSLVQLREALLERSAPDIVVLAYADFHDMRNTLRRTQQKSLVSANKLGPLMQPFAWMDEHGQVRTAARRAHFEPWPLMRYSALVHLCERVYDRLELISAPNHEITVALIRQFQEECASHGAAFVLAGIRSTDLTRQTLAMFAEEGVRSVDISVDPELPENTNLPHDGHPSAHAHRQFAKRLGTFLATLSPTRETDPLPR